VEADALALTLGRVRTARQDDLSQLFDAHWAPLCRLAFVLLGDATAAEDVVQEAFLGTFRGWARLRDPDRAGLYLRRAVVNASRSRLRRRPLEQRANAIAHGRSDDTGRDWTDASSDAAIVLEAVRRLPERQRSAVVLRYYLDLPEAEIAETLGVAPGTVKSQLAKARKTLARELEP
jgi:RNA polymerase sigma-70 factor (sigma-E family)